MLAAGYNGALHSSRGSFRQIMVVQGSGLGFWKGEDCAGVVGDGRSVHTVVQQMQHEQLPL